jgi:hypothetical protein
MLQCFSVLQQISRCFFLLQANLHHDMTDHINVSTYLLEAMAHLCQGRALQRVGKKG